MGSHNYMDFRLMRSFVGGLRALWRDIEENPPCAPPGCNKGGGLSFIVWFGGFGLWIVIMLLDIVK